MMINEKKKSYFKNNHTNLHIQLIMMNNTRNITSICNAASIVFVPIPISIKNNVVRGFGSAIGTAL